MLSVDINQQWRKKHEHNMFINDRSIMHANPQTKLRQPIKQQPMIQPPKIHHLAQIKPQSTIQEPKPYTTNQAKTINTNKTITTF